MKDRDRFIEHLKRIKGLTDQLAATGAGIEEEDQTATLLGSLPPSYAVIVTALETQINGNLTLQRVQQVLINEEQKQVNANGNFSHSSDSVMKITEKNPRQTHRNDPNGTQK